MADRTLSHAFPVKPKQKPTSKTTSKSPESKHWSSFKTDQIQNLISVPNLTFSPNPPHRFAASHSATVTIYDPKTLSASGTISSFKDVVACASFRSDGQLLAASDLSGLIQVFDVKTRTALRRLRSHARPVRFVQYPFGDKLHLVSGGDDGLVKWWDVAGEAPILSLLGHRDYVRCGDCSPVGDDVFVTGSYDHTVKLWDVRERSGRERPVMEVNHGSPVEDVIFLPSGGLVATAGGSAVKIWDLMGGGKLVHSMESHTKTVTSICVAKIGRTRAGMSDSMQNQNQNRIMSVGLDGYLKVFDYSRMKVTHSMRFPAPLLSVGFSPDSMTRVIGSANGVVYVGRRKTKEKEGSLGQIVGSVVGGGELARKRVLRPSNFRYFHRGQGEKPALGDYLVLRPKKVKMAEHDKLLKKFRHKEALVSVLGRKNPENVVAVMEELVARKKLMKCVSNLDTEELGLLLIFLQKYATVGRFSGLLMGLAKKVFETRAEEIRASEPLMKVVRNLKGSVQEEIRIQHSLQEIQGIISPLLRIAGGR